jgi:uncharacterized protein (DUF302 family)
MQEALVQMVTHYNEQGLTVFAVLPHRNILASVNDPSTDTRNPE